MSGARGPASRAWRALCVAFAAWAACAAPLLALGTKDRGTTGAQFLKLSPGARAAAMGSAFSAVADDATAAYYDPAGLADLRGPQAAGMHNSHFQGFSHDYGAVAIPLLSWVDTRRPRNDLGVLALSLTSLRVGGIERRGVVETDEPEGTFGAGDFAYGLAYGLRVTRGLSLGAGLKLLDQRIDSARARGAALDAGLLSREGRWSWAAGFRNAGRNVRFRAESDPLPFVAYAGAAVAPAAGWLGALELRAPRDGPVGYSLGGEWRRSVVDGLSGCLRGGYDSDTAQAGGLGGWTMGAGVALKSLELDFAWVPYGELGHTFRYSFLVKW